MDIFVWYENEQLGPFDQATLIQHLQEGTFSEETLAWYEGLNDWRLLGEILSELKPTPVEPVQLDEMAEGYEMSIATGRRDYRIPVVLGILFLLGVSAGVWIGLRLSNTSPPAITEKRATSTPMASVGSTGTMPQLSAAAVVTPVQANENSEFIPQPTIPSDPQSSVINGAAPAGSPVSEDKAPLQISPDANKLNFQPPAITTGVSAEMGQPVKKAIADATVNADTQVLAPFVIAEPLKNGVNGVDVYVANHTEKPTAILVLCVDKIGGCEKMEVAPEWVQFVTEQNLGLIVMAFTADKTVTANQRGYRADEGMGTFLLNTVRSSYGNDVPLLLYGISRGGTFAASFANWRPDRLMAWGGYTNQWLEKPTKSQVNPPGFIAYDEENTSWIGITPDAFFDIGRALGKPLMKICDATRFETRKATLNTFVRDYFSSILSGEAKEESLLLRIKDKKKATSLDIMADPKQLMWLPSPRFLELWTALNTRPESTPASELPTIIKRTVETKNPQQPELQLFLRLPPGKTATQVAGVLAFCTWERNGASILSKLSAPKFEKPGTVGGPTALVAQLVQFAEKHNLAILTWGTARAWSTKKSTDEMDRAEERATDRNFDILAAAWEKGVAMLAKDTGMPANNFLLYGISGGAQWAHRLALRKPEYFLAVSVHINSTYDKPTPEAACCLWLTTTGDKEGGYPAAKRFYIECQQLGYPILFKAGENLGHSDSPQIDALRDVFFEYALSIREKRRNFGKKDAFVLAFKKLEQTVPIEFKNAPFYGDFINNEVFSAANAGMIPEGQRVPIPTETLANAWGQVIK